MKILVLGSGGREDAICWKINESGKVEELYAAPGNPGTAKYAVNQDIDIKDNEEIKKFCLDKKIDLVVIGPEAPLARGITDMLESEGIKVCGPSYAASRMESSKIFAKQVMGRYSVPTAHFRIYTDIKKAYEFIDLAKLPIVVKADGLAAGKGVIVAQTTDEAKEAVRMMIEGKEFGAAGTKVILEECLKGEEVSILVLSDGKNIIPLATSQDHKRIHEGDTGPNTGGMGAYSPAPAVTPELLEVIKEIILMPVIDGLRKEEMPYKGILYAGIMLTGEGPKVLEFNVRFGDPEAQAILPRLKTDFVDILKAIADGDISKLELEWDERACVCVVLASGGYPGQYEKGKEITGINEAENTGAIVFQAGTEEKDGKIVTSGGRVLGVTALGNGIQEAIDKAYEGVSKINFEGMTYRKDIAYRAVDRQKA